MVNRPSGSGAVVASLARIVGGMATNAPARLNAGDTAPSFTLPDAQGTDVSLSDFAGRRVVVYFYPAAMTPGCTTEAIDFSSSLDAFRESGYEVLGISPDPVERLARFTDKEQLGSPCSPTRSATCSWPTALTVRRRCTARRSRV